MKLVAALVILLMSVIGSGSVYIKLIKSENETLVLKNEGLERQLAVEVEKRKFEEHQNHLALERIKFLQQERKKDRENVEYLREVYAGHDFGKLLASKPGLITKKMLSATQSKLNELQAITAE